MRILERHEKKWSLGEMILKVDEIVKEIDLHSSWDTLEEIQFWAEDQDTEEADAIFEAVAESCRDLDRVSDILDQVRRNAIWDYSARCPE